MPKPKHLHPDTLLSIRLSATMSRNRYTSDPGPVIDELRQIAGDRLDILADEVGTWIGYFEDDHTRTLTTALRALPLDMDDAIALGQRRRHEPPPSTVGFRDPTLG
ncbi:hypothetical protein ACI3KS_05040 [Microbacterium sp. ZW T5_45]|uniref:hypothetical protein n=1 Tax=Microbacterium sp. ZW T5_45 TaxID=3378080 RepID=UPI003854B418